jgi:hypothetical protein
MKFQNISSLSSINHNSSSYKKYQHRGCWHVIYSFLCRGLHCKFLHSRVFYIFSYLNCLPVGSGGVISRGTSLIHNYYECYILKK